MLCGDEGMMSKLGNGLSDRKGGVVPKLVVG